MEGDNGARQRPGRGPPAPPPPPPPGHEEEANGGGHRRGGQTKNQIFWPRCLRRVAVALVVMIAAALYLLFAEALAVAAPPISAAWYFVAFALWIIGLNMLYSWMN